MPRKKSPPAFRMAEDPQEPDKPAFEPVIVTMSDVEPEPIEWLWPGRFALGKLHLIAGDGGRGKSTLTVDLAARVSTGEAWPDGTANIPPADVLILSAEDDPADTIRPRLDAARADVSRVRCLTGVRASDGSDQREYHVTLADVHHLETALASYPDCRLLIVDPVAAFTGNADSHVDADVRGLLAPLAKLAAERRVAVVLVAHLNKGNAVKAIYRISGSQGFYNACRIAWFVTDADDDEDKRLLLPAKNNLAKSPGGLAFMLRSMAGEVAHVEWIDGRVDVDLDEVMAGPRDTNRGTKADAKGYLLEALADGPRPQAELEKGSPVSLRTLKTAKGELGIRSIRPGGSGPWLWELPTGGASTPSHTLAPLHGSPDPFSRASSEQEGNSASIVEGGGTREAEFVAAGDLVDELLGEGDPA